MRPKGHTIRKAAIALGHMPVFMKGVEIYDFDTDSVPLDVVLDDRDGERPAPPLRAPMGAKAQSALLAIRV